MQYMFGAKKIIITSLVTLITSLSLALVSATSQAAPLNPTHTPSANPPLAHINSSDIGLADINQTFASVFSKIRAGLIDAPEASRLYVGTIIDLYNAEPRNPVSAPPAYKTVPAQPSPINYTPTGSWIPNGRPVVSPEWVGARPLELTHAAQFRPPAPPPTPQAFEAALEYVFSIGEDASETRLSDQSVAARFWADGIGTISPPGRWNKIALEQSQNWPRKQRLELLLALNIALYDVGIAAWDSKYHYQYWRPGTAISQTHPDFADWAPMMEPPFHPEYVSGHSSFSGAAAAILTAFFGPHEFCITSDELLGLTRCFSSFNAAAEDAGLSRIYGGIHFQFSNKEGLLLGRKVAAHTLETLTKSGYIITDIQKNSFEKK